MCTTNASRVCACVKVKTSHINVFMVACVALSLGRSILLCLPRRLPVCVCGWRNAVYFQTKSTAHAERRRTRERAREHELHTLIETEKKIDFSHVQVYRNDLKYTRTCMCLCVARPYTLRLDTVKMLLLHAHTQLHRLRVTVRPRQRLCLCALVCAV